jgi:hypothetical protein
LVVAGLEHGVCAEGRIECSQYARAGAF